MLCVERKEKRSEQKNIEEEKQFSNVKIGSNSGKSRIFSFLLVVKREDENDNDDDDEDEDNS